MKKTSTLFHLLVAVIIFSVFAFAADTISAQSISKDATQATFICRIQPEANPAENNEGNYGAAPTLHARGVQGGKAFRSDMLVRFDLAGLKGTVSRAVIRMHKTAAPYVEPMNSGPNPIAAYPLLAGWDEGKVTWDTFYKQNAPLFGRPVGVTSVGDKNEYYQWEIPASLVQQWVVNPDSNHGVIFISQVTRNPHINTYFHSNNSPFPPLLVVEMAKPGQVISRPDTDLVLKNKYMAVSFGQPKNGLGLTSLYDMRNSAEHIAKGGNRLPIWKLAFRNLATGKTEVVDSPGNVPATVERYQEYGSSVLECRWKGVSLPGDAGTCDVKAIILMDDDKPDVRWRIQVDNHSKTHSLWSVDYPIVPGVGEKGVTAYTQLWSAIGSWKTEFTGPIDFDMVGGLWPMQFFALSTRKAGLYMSTMDSREALKHIYFDMGKDFHFTHYPQAMSVPAQTYAMPYEVDMKLFSGDWYDAAKLYRDWALDQPWTARGPLKLRRSHGSKAEPGVVDTGLWLKDHRKADDSLVKDAVAIRNYFGVPIGIHLYDWHNCFFDGDYPEFLPIPNVDQFKKSVTAMQRAGITVMPYVQASIWNKTIPSFETVRADAVYNVDGTMNTPIYNELEFGTMWPGSKPFQDRLANITRELARCGIKATYLDLMGANPPQLNFGGNHGHAGSGASGEWVDGYRELVSRLRQESRKEGVEMPFVTELASESYMDAVQGFLTWWTRDEGAVPILPAVYGGYTTYIGEGVYQDEDDAHFCMRTGRNFLWGTALGWGSDSGTDVARYKSLINTPSGEFLRTLLRYRVAAKDYIVYGEMLRELPNLAPQKTIIGKTKTGTLKLPAVINSVWHALDGTSAVVIVNLDTKSQEVSYKANPAQLGLKTSKSGYALQHLGEDGKTQSLQALKEGFVWKGVMKPREVYVLKIASK